MFLEEALQSDTTTILLMNGNDDISVFTCGLWLDYNIVSIANMIVDHRMAFDNQSVRTLLFQFLTHIQPQTLLYSDFNRLTCGNISHDMIGITLSCRENLMLRLFTDSRMM